MLAVCRSWTWHLFAFVSGWGHLISSFLPPWVWVISFDLSSALFHVVMTSNPLMSNTAKSTIVPPICSREVCLYSFRPPSNSLLVLIHKHHIPLSRVDDVAKSSWEVKRDYQNPWRQKWRNEMSPTRHECRQVRCSIVTYCQHNYNMVSFSPTISGEYPNYFWKPAWKG